MEALLEPWVADPADRAFVARCLLDEGPPHHRGANAALLTLLQRALSHTKPGGRAADLGAMIPVALRVPPHVRESLDAGERVYPVAMPSAALERAFPDPRVRRHLVESLTDGPPHHAIANVLMVAMITELLARLGDGDSPLEPSR